MSERQEAANLDEIEISHRVRYYRTCGHIYPNSNVLDVACGIGYGAFIMALNSEAIRIDAFDRDRGAIHKAITHYPHPKVNYHVAEIEEVHLIPNFYDCITAFEIIEHLRNPTILLNKLFDSIKDSGQLFLSTPNEETMPFDSPLYPEHIRHYTKDEIVSMLNLCGFKVTQIKSQRGKFNPAILPNDGGKYILITCQK